MVAPVELFDHISSAIILVTGDSLLVTYLNLQARQWLGDRLSEHAEGQLTFQVLFPEVNLSRLKKRLNRSMRADFKVSIPHQETVIPLGFTVKTVGEDLLIEGVDETPLSEVHQMLASYSDLIEKKNKRLVKEQRRVERLLYNILPDKCVQQLRSQGHTTPERFSDVSVLFLDFVGFTELSMRLSTKKLFEELNDIFTAFDTIITRHRCERIKTIGDAYLAVCGMPTHQDDHAKLISCAALKMREYIQARNQHMPTEWRCRIGIHSGEVTGGVVGRLKYIYDIFGDGVNTASRMESYSEPMKINISAQLRAKLDDSFVVTPRGPQEVKGKGKLAMYYLESVVGEPCASRLQDVSDILNPQDTNDSSITPVMLMS